MQDRNLLLEQRVVRQNNAGPQQSVYRLWHLGFVVDTDGCDAAAEEDEEESKLWEHSIKGRISIFVDGSSMFLVDEKSRKLHQLDSVTGNFLVDRTAKFDKWIQKGVISPCGNYIAVAHFGSIAILSRKTMSTEKVISSPIQDDKYPLIPLSFFENCQYLVCRVNFSRMLLIFSLIDHEVVTIFKNLGGTISDASCTTPDGSGLVCWPFGSIEVFDLSAITQVMAKKIKSRVKMSMVLIRQLLLQNRCFVVKEEDIPGLRLESVTDTSIRCIQNAVLMLVDNRLLSKVYEYL